MIKDPLRIPSYTLCAALLSLCCFATAQQSAEVSDKTRKRFESKSARQRLRALRKVIDKSRRAKELDEIILRALDDQDARIRLIAVEAIRRSKTKPKDLPTALIARLADDDLIARAAMQAIAQTKSWARQAREPICKLAQSLATKDSFESPVELIRCLAAIDDPRVIQALAKAARLGDQDRGLAAVAGLELQSAEGHIEALFNATRSAHASVRAAAVQTIRKRPDLSHHDQIHLIATLLRDEANIVREAAGETLMDWSKSLNDTAMLMWIAYRPQFSELQDSADQNLKLWAKAILGTLEAESLEAAAAHPDAAVRRRCYELLTTPSKTQPAQAPLAMLDSLVIDKLLVMGLRDTNSGVVRAALAYTVKLGRKAASAAPSLIALLIHSEDRKLRQRAADALEALGEQAIPPLITSLADAKLRNAVTTVLTRFEATDAMLDGLDHKDPNVRAAVADILGKTASEDDSTLYGLLVERLTDPSSKVIEATIVSLDRNTNPAVRALRAALQADPPLLRRRAALVLGELQRYPRCPIAVNIAALSDEHPPFRILALGQLAALPAQQALGHLLTALGDPSVEVQRAAIGKLRDFADEAKIVVPELVRLVQRVPGPESDPGGLERLARRRETVAAATALGVTGLPVITAALELPWPQSPGERYHASQLTGRALAILAKDHELARRALPSLLGVLERGDCQLKEQLIALRLLEAIFDHDKEGQPGPNPSRQDPKVISRFIPVLRTVLKRSHEDLRRVAVGSRLWLRGTLRLHFAHQAAALRLLGRCGQPGNSTELALAISELEERMDADSSTRGTAQATRVKLAKDERSQREALRFLASDKIRNFDHVGDLLRTLADNPQHEDIVRSRSLELLGTPFLHQEVVEYLGDARDRDPEVVAALTKLLDDRDSNVVRAAIKGLSRRGQCEELIGRALKSNETMLALIGTAISEAEPQAFIKLFLALEAQANPERKLRRLVDAVHPQHPELTLALLRSPRAEHRAFLERRLSRLYASAPDVTSAILLDFLLDPSTAGQTEIIQAILSLGIEPNAAHLPGLERRFRAAKDPSPIARLILRVGKPAVPSLISLLDQAPEPVLAALRDLGPDALDAIKPVLNFALRETEWLDTCVLTLASIGPRAHTALSQLGVDGEAMVQVLLQVLQNSKDPRVLAATARLLQLYRDHADQAPEVLATLLPSAVQPARAWFALTLASLRPDSPQAAEALLDTLAEPDASLRRHAVRGLGQMKDPTGYYRAMLITLVTDPDQKVRAAAERALAKQTARDGKPDKKD